MSRSYARIMTAIWRNREFRALDAAMQRVYLLLVTQPDISAAGTLPLTVRRWADMAADTTPQDITAALTVLAAKNFVVFDRDTEELLVRSFVKWDAGYTNSKRIPVIKRAGAEIASEALRRVLAAEFGRLGLPTAFLLDSPSDALSDGDDDPDGAVLPEPDPETLFPQVDSLSDRASGGVSPSEGVVATEVSTGEPAIRNPHTPSLRSGSAPTRAPSKKRGTRIPDDFSVTAEMTVWARENAPDVAPSETGLFIDYWKQATRNAEKRDWKTAWQVWMRKEQKRINERRPLHPVATPGRVETGSTRMNKALSALVDDDPFLAQYAQQPTPGTEGLLVIEGGRSA